MQAVLSSYGKGGVFAIVPIFGLQKEQLVSVKTLKSGDGGSFMETFGLFAHCALMLQTNENWFTIGRFPLLQISHWYITSTDAER